MTEESKLYLHLLRDHPLPHCWACGRGKEDRPLGWSSPWFIERHHIVRSRRVLSRWLVNLLCSACHKTAHGERLIVNGEPWPLPKLETCHMLWLKLKRDPEFYRREYLQRHNVRKLPMAIVPPKAYLLEYAERRGEVHEFVS